MPDVRTLPYRRELLDHLRAEKERGRRLVLATAADETMALRVAEQVGLFDAVFASDGVTNLSGDRKRDRLVKEFGLKGFDYVGNSSRDRNVWKAARKTILVHPKSRPRGLAKKEVEFDRVFQCEPTGWKIYLQALRPSHWLKNALVFLPLIAAHQFYGVALLVHALLAFIVLSLCASSVYLLNDLVDLDEDRRHTYKRRRMLASGHLPVTHALTMIPILIFGALALSLTQPTLFLLVIGTYWVLMLAYCLKLRSLALWDAMTLAAGYSLRVVAGSVATNIGVSYWLLGSVFLLFFGFALLKRYTELIGDGVAEQTNGRIRGYTIDDRGRIAVYGCISNCLALLVLGFYLATDTHRYARYELMWLSYLLLAYWTARVWRIAERGEIRSDPVSFALNDPLSRILAVLMATSILVAA